MNDLNQAYQNFFQSCKCKRKGVGANGRSPLKPPQFKSRKSKQTARFVGGNYKIDQDKIYLPKVGKIKIVWSRPLPSKPTSVSIIKDSADRPSIASFVVETCAEYLPKTESYIGIDLGISTFATLINGDKIEAPKPLKQNLKKLAKFQRKFAKTQPVVTFRETSVQRREKRRLKIARLHAKIKDIRADFLHKLSTEIIRKNQTIVLEV
ncbi:transposase [Okeania sp. SIO3I5]|uniref:RNA-guided endonuclease InsQ/TnpB family protein n=1 Tax=Okeania sp. SIO3I5 TaxID=2607805 RepID=UPI0025F22CB9|nr:transposase [Okeania sp. SIO3I5]